MKTTYEKTVTLEHDESLFKINKDNGEMKEVITRPNNIPTDSEVFEPQAIFRKDYTNSWKFLEIHLSDIEFRVAWRLAVEARANTNSLEPLDDETTIPELMEVMGVSKNKVKPILAKLWDIGVFGRFEVKDKNKPYTKYWVLNPYLSFSGKLIKSDIAGLFSGTHLAAAFYNPDYQYKYLRGKKR